jgi:hypothetical protein
MLQYRKKVVSVFFLLPPGSLAAHSPVTAAAIMNAPRGTSSEKKGLAVSAGILFI